MFYLTVSVWGSVRQLQEAANRFGRVKIARFFVTYPYLAFSKQTTVRVLSGLRQVADEVEFALDSGGFVGVVKLNRSVKEPSLVSYACFLRQWGHLFNFALSWDYGDPTQCYEHFKFLTRQGLNVVPVWHIGDPPDLLTDYCKVSEWVAIGGFGRFGRHNAKLELLFINLATLLTDMAQRFGTKFHALGVGFNTTLLKIWQPDSADSTTPLQSQRYGWLITVKDDKILRKRFTELTDDLLPVPVNEFMTNSRLRTIVVAHAALKVTELLNLKGWGTMLHE